MKSLCFSLLLIAVLLGCSKSSDPTPAPVVPDATITFTGTTKGRFADSFLISWTATNAASLSSTMGTNTGTAGTAKLLFVTETKTITVTAQGTNGKTVSQTCTITVDPITDLMNKIAGALPAGKKYKLSNHESYSKADMSDRFQSGAYAGLSKHRWTFMADGNMWYYNPEITIGSQTIASTFSFFTKDGKQMFKFLSFETELYNPPTATGFVARTAPTFNDNGSVKTYGSIYTFVLEP